MGTCVLPSMASPLQVRLFNGDDRKRHYRRINDWHMSSVLLAVCVSNWSDATWTTSLSHSRHCAISIMGLGVIQLHQIIMDTITPLARMGILCNSWFAGADERPGRWKTLCYRSGNPVDAAADALGTGSLSSWLSIIARWPAKCDLMRATMLYSFWFSRN